MAKFELAIKWRGNSVLRVVQESDIRVEKYVCSDINKGLVYMWDLIKAKPNEVYGSIYKKRIERV